MTKTILVTGANGFLGQHLCFYLQDKNCTLIATGKGNSRLSKKFRSLYENVDLVNKVAVDFLITKHQPEVIIHTAAMSKPDECDKQREACFATNVTATKNLLAHPAHFIYTSTDFIFGENGPHSEDDTPSPLNYYGQTKLEAEQAVRESGVKYSIVRPVFIYGKTWEGMRPTFLHWVKANLEAGKQIKVVSDQRRTPTFVDDICKGIASITKNDATGVYHLAGKDILSPYEMALKTAEVLKLDKSLIIEATSATFHEPVVRAKRSGLKIDKAVKDLEYFPVSFEDGIKLTFDLH